ncbi:hypothetical protein CXB51_026056 [Gossypium anomalum]|uniref:DUF2415 domain-containing protein n=1 Tax=Gossypium anomalum TaxID=47600 RepID=A0A8J5YL14_9ROSI|nr:hypothetical protein CXB51_026056 [Gossypium anomalum]
MSRLQLEDFYYMAEDIIDDMDEDDYGRAGGDMDAHEYDMGRYRLTRLEQYKNYENIPASGDAVDKECKQMEKGGNYYEFFHNTRLVKPTILHFQLRNLVWATSKHDVYLMSNYSVMHWSSLSCHLSEILNFSGHVAPTEVSKLYLLAITLLISFLIGMSDFEDSYLFSNYGLLLSPNLYCHFEHIQFVGSISTISLFLCLQHLDRKGVAFCTRTTYDDNAITNAIEIYDSLRGGINFMAANNDCSMREYDTERFQLLNHLRFPWPVNHTSVSPDRRLITVVGDSLDGLLVDLQNGKTVARVVGHLDYSFASAWHPDGRIFATGNQDKTCRVWDVRNLSRPVVTLKGNLGAIRSIRFSSDGQFMVAAEPADFVHVYSTRADFEKRQEIDFFGEISGVSLSPDDESLYIGIWDRTYASLLQYNKRHTYAYLDSYL